MAVRIRLRKAGRRNRPFYHIVVADSRSPRDGKFIERLGFYNPLVEPEELSLNTERLLYWLEKGAKMSDTVSSLARRKGLLRRESEASKGSESEQKVSPEQLNS